jgi:hypothetical protein
MNHKRFTSLASVLTRFCTLIVYQHGRSYCIYYLYNSMLYIVCALAREIRDFISTVSDSLGHCHITFYSLDMLLCGDERNKFQ